MEIRKMHEKGGCQWERGEEGNDMPEKRPQRSAPKGFVCVHNLQKGGRPSFYNKKKKQRPRKLLKKKGGRSLGKWGKNGENHRVKGTFDQVKKKKSRKYP